MTTTDPGVGQHGATNAPAPPSDVAEGSFLLLLRRGPGAVEPDAGPERDRMIDRYSAWRDDLERGGALLLSRLLDAGSAVELSGSADGVTRQHRSPREGGEYVSGLYLVAARDLDSAEAIARSSPHLDYGGTIEVRPVVTPPDRKVR